MKEQTSAFCKKMDSSMFRQAFIQMPNPKTTENNTNISCSIFLLGTVWAKKFFSTILGVAAMALLPFLFFMIFVFL